MRSKKTKRIVAAVLAAVLLAGGGTGAFFLVRHNGKAVNVFAVSEIGQTDMWMDNAQYEGNVRAENLQSVYLSDTQQLKEVFVHEGDAVKKGDKLAAFDTTLSDLELERQKIEVQKLELNLSNLQSALRRINSMTPYVPPTPAPAPAPEELDPVELPRRLSGNGTEAKPYVYLWNETCQYDDAFIAQILPLKEAETAPAGEETTAAAEETEEANGPVYEPSVTTVIFQVREYDNPKGELIYTWGMTFTRKPDGGYFFTVFQPDDSFAGNDTQELAELPEIDPEGGYTAAEIARMRSETQQDIRDTETKLKVERLKLKKLELEISTGVVTASLDGVIKSVCSEDEARSEGKPVVTLSAGGAWYIDASVGELDLQHISVGDTAEIQSWMNDGGFYDGKVTAVSQYPVTGGWYGGNGNPNVSYYPVTVEVDASAALQEGDYVSVSFTGASGGSGLYLEKPFILTENGHSYVYAMNEDEKLEKREIVTGKIYWGSTVEIVSGLTLADYIAFPYGKDVKDGAKATLSDMSAMYEAY